MRLGETPKPPLKAGSVKRAGGGPLRPARPSILVVAGLIAGAVNAGAQPVAAALPVEIGGCSSVVRGPVCELPDDRMLHLWVPDVAPDRLEVRVNGGAVPPAARAEQGGASFAVDVPAGGRELSVRRGTRHALIALRQARVSPAVLDAERLRKSGDIDGAVQRLADPLGDPDPGVRGRAMAELSRVDLARGRTEQAIVGLREAARLSAVGGRLSDEFIARTALAFTLMYNGRRFAEARAELARASGHDGGDGASPASDEVVAWAPRHEGLLYYEGILADETGDERAALNLLRASRRRAERLGSSVYRWAAIQAEANTLSVLGRNTEGEATLRDAEPLIPAGDPCARAGFLTNVGWLSLSAAMARELPGPATASRALEEAAGLYAGGGCAKPWARANALTNLALAAISASDPGKARARLAEARAAAGATTPDARITEWWQDLEGRIALAEGRPAEALAAYERLARLALGAYLPAAEWRAAVGRALALEALGSDAAAAAAYAEAETLLDRHRLLAPLGEGRETFLGRFEESGRLRVRFLLERDARAAAVAARRSRARALAGLRWAERITALDAGERVRWDRALAAYRTERDALSASARDDWQLPEDRLAETRETRSARELELVAALETALAVLGSAGPDGDGAGLAPPGDREIVLVYHPIPGGLAAFAITSAGVEAHRLAVLPDAAGPAALAQHLLAPFRAAIDVAERLRVVAAGPLERVDFHALPWEGRPLVARVPVVYGVDRPGLAAAAAGPLRGTAVIVADPLQDLAGARREAREVAERLAADGYQVRVLAGAAATRAAVREALEAPDTAIFHYAGHGVYAGPDGWASALPLAGGEALSVGDVLALVRVPREVVLSACDTARSGTASPVAGLGLGQAFVIAGADAVLAATRPVGDGLAARMIATFHRATRTIDPAERLRRATLASLDGEPDADVSSFRLLVP